MRMVENPMDSPLIARAILGSGRRVRQRPARRSVLDLVRWLLWMAGARPRA